MDGYVPEMEGAVEQSASTGPAQVSPRDRLLAFIAAGNIAEAMQRERPDELAKLGERVVCEYDIDHDSCTQWREDNEEACRLAMLVGEQKDYPFDKAANVKYPLLTTAALQFNARAYPAIVPGDRLVKGKTFGNDPQGAKAARADRVGEFLSYQLLKEMPEWEEDTDRLLVILPIVGCAFRKTYYDPALGRKCSRLVPAERFVVNYFARSLEDTPRATEELDLYPHEIEERIRSGRFVEFDYKATAGADDDAEGQKQAGAGQDDDAPQRFLEQHRLYDLDEDGYAEPYICTVHKATQQVVRIVANFTPETIVADEAGNVLSVRRQEFFTKYLFLPSPDGGFYGMGFGKLLKSISESVNTTLNEMLDAGHLSNIRGGLVSSTLGLREKSITLKMGEFRVINTTQKIGDAVMPMQFDGPSAVLFNLLGLLIEAGKEIASIKDVLTGEQKTNMPATTTIALIEQGLQVFTSIYKRIHRALGRELEIHCRLNSEHVAPEQYAAFFDGQPADPKADFNIADMDVLPVTDPSAVSKMQKLAKAQFVYETAKENPLVNQEVALRRMYEAADVDDVDELIVPPPQPDPAEVAFMEAVKQLGLQEQMAKITELYTKSIKNVADAEAAEEGQQLSLYDMFLRALTSEHSMEMDLNGQGRVPGVEGEPGNPMGTLPAQGDSAGRSAAPAGPALQPIAPAAGGLGGPAAAGVVPEGAL